VTDNPRCPDLIYVVEDDPDVSRLIEHNLRNAGYDVSTFFSGAPVVPMATMAQPALFLLDIMLPGISGFDLCCQIRQHERLGKTPVIFLSAKTQEPDRLQAFDAGGDGYITKPFSPRELIARVRNVLRLPLTIPNPASPLSENAARNRLPVRGRTLTNHYVCKEWNRPVHICRFN
jgi:DNA-binding response OmpR family regulator